MTQPKHIVEGMVRITPVVRSVLTNEPQPDEAASYVQFVNTQALLLMSDEKRLQKIVDDLAGRNLAFFSGKPSNRMERLLAKIMPKDINDMPDEILRKAIASEKISAGYLPNSELMAVTMRSQNLEEARIIVNSFLRNYVGQYGIDVTTSESQNITILENQRDEIQKRIMESRARIRDLAADYGTTEINPHQEIEMNRRSALQGELTRLEAMKIKVDADIGTYEKAEKLDRAPEELMQARMTYINADPMIKELTTRIVQTELDLIVARQTQPAADATDTQREAVLKALQQKLEEKRLTLTEEFNKEMESNLREAARQRVAQARTEKAQIEAQIEGIRQAISDQEVRMIEVGNTNLGIQDLQRKLTMDEETFDKVNRRLRAFEMEWDRRPRVQIASLAEVKEVVDHRWQWTFVVFVATVALSIVLLNVLRTTTTGPQPETSGA
jgi:uncharacterized protein involved in exopolysaccharide biosynthesis